MIAPITEKGKAKRLNGVNLQRCTSEGMYFRYEGGYVTLANYTTQRTYYSSAFAGLSAMSEEETQGTGIKFSSREAGYTERFHWKEIQSYREISEIMALDFRYLSPEISWQHV